MYENQKWYKALSCALENSVQERQDKVDSRKTQVTRYLSLSDREKYELVAYVMKNKGCDPAAAVETVKQSADAAVRTESGGWLKIIRLLPLLLILLVRSDAVTWWMAFVLMFACLALVFMIVAAINPQKQKAEKIWRTRSMGEGDAIRALEEMEKTLDKGWFACVSKPLFFGCLAVFVALAMVFAIPYLPDPAHVKLGKEISSDASDTRVARAAEYVLQKDPAAGPKAQKMIDKADAWLRKETTYWPYRFPMASLVAELTGSGLDEGFAEKYILEALTKGSYFLLDESYPLEDIIARCPEDQLRAALTRCLETADEDQQWLLESFVDVCDGMGYEEKIAIADEVDAAGFDGLAFLGVSMSDFTPETAAAEVATLEGDTQLRIAAAFGEKFYEIDDVLAYIYACREIGIMPSQVYPEGAQTSYAITGRLDTTPDEFIWERVNKYIFVSRVEKPEPLEVRRAGAGNANEAFGDGYDGNDKSDPENFSFLLETRWMDALPMENMASSLEACDTAIVLDTVYISDGNWEFTEELGENSSYADVLGSLMNKDVYVTYACRQSVGLVDLLTGNLIGYYGDEITYSPEELPEDFSVRMSNSGGIFASGPDEKMRPYYSAQPIENWHDSHVEELIDFMQELDWKMEYVLLMKEVEE